MMIFGRTDDDMFFKSTEEEEEVPMNEDEIRKRLQRLVSISLVEKSVWDACLISRKLLSDIRSVEGS